MLYLASPPELCRALSNIVRRCTYLVCFCRVTNYNVCQVSSLSRLFDCLRLQRFVLVYVNSTALYILITTYEVHVRPYQTLHASNSYTCLTSLYHVLLLTLPLRASSDTSHLTLLTFFTKLIERENSETVVF